VVAAERLGSAGRRVSPRRVHDRGRNAVSIGSSRGAGNADGVGRMSDNRRRLVLYGAAAVVIGGLAVLGSREAAEADAMTLIGSANVQLRLAYGMPSKDRHGKPLSSRVDLITSAVSNLERVERLGLAIACASELRGFAASLQEDFSGAAEWYAKAQTCADVEAEQKDVLAFNEARMLAKAGKADAALACFSRYASALDQRFGHQRTIEEATILAGIGRRQEAEARLAKVAQAADADAGDRLRAGEAYVAIGAVAEAAAVLTQAAVDAPFANYLLAKLKLQQGEVDSGLDLLAAAAKALPTEVKRALRKDAHVWSVAAADARYQAIAGTPAAVPAR
jgi:tetratricopeptide (TPR) repeat protein